MPVSPQSTPKPSPLLALTAAAIAGAFDHRWLARPVVDLAAEHDVSAERVSRLRARLQPGFEEDVAGRTRGRRLPAVEAAETSETIADTIGRAVGDRPGTQVITDQGTPFLADLSRAAHDAMHPDHAPCAEGPSTHKAPLERSFETVKRLLEPLAELTRKLADLVPALRCDGVGRPVAALLLATYLRVFEFGYRDRPHPLDAADPQLLRDIAAEQREKARHETDSKRLLLGEIFDGLGCSGSREHFIRNFRHHKLEDIQIAQRDFVNNWHCCCRINSPERAFAWQLWRGADYDRRQRAAAHARCREQARREHQLPLDTPRPRWYLPRCGLRTTTRAHHRACGIVRRDLGDHDR